MSAWTRPPALRRGGRIGICAPSGPVDEERLRRGADALRGLGFEVHVPDGLTVRTGFTAGSVARRRAELEGLFEDPSIDAILCARGGAGAAQLLPELDAGKLRAHPKPFVGYSDVTALHQLLNGLGIVSFHGPMLARDLAEPGGFHRESLLHALTGEGEAYATPDGLLRALAPGRAEGTLRGGCLSLLASAAGTPWAFDSRGEDVLLFLEDVNEPAYRFDRMLRQLRESQGLRRVVGVVLGTLSGCRMPPEADFDLDDLVRDALGLPGVPIASGLPSGHVEAGNVTLPFGVPARLVVEGESASLRVLEAAVAVT